jgi:hypothetical protein
VKRNLRLVFATMLLALLSATAAQAAPHMWIGFQDDASFRWRPERGQNLADAQQANATIVRAWVVWPQIAPTRPANASDSFDPAYRFDDLDELVRNAQARGLEVLLSPWGTPKWANGGKTPNYAPRNVADWTNFIRALADRYSGKHPGFPAVRFWSIWNEPNLNQFLAPQFVGKKDASPAIYAKLYRAAYTAIKRADPTSVVAVWSRWAKPLLAAATSRSGRRRRRTRTRPASSRSCWRRRSRGSPSTRGRTTRTRRRSPRRPARS